MNADRAGVRLATGLAALFLSAAATPAIAQSLPSVNRAADLCNPERVIWEVGAPQKVGPYDFYPAPIHGMIIEFQVGTNHLAVGLFSLARGDLDEIRGPLFLRVLQELQIPPESVRNVSRCAPFFSHSMRDGDSYLHQRLIRILFDFDRNVPTIDLRTASSRVYALAPLLSNAPPLDHPKDLPGKSKVPASKDPKSAPAAPPRGSAAAPTAPRRKADDKSKVATLGPPDPESEKPLKLYAKPQYPLLAASSASQSKDSASRTGRAVFAVEKVECSEQGNWMTGYFGILHELENGRKLVIKQRYGVNNYPGEGVIGLAELKSQKKKELTCAATDFTCSAPRETQTYEQFLKSDQKSAERAPAPSGPLVSIAPIELTSPPELAEKSSQWSCRPDRNLCVSRATDHWQCDPQGTTCASYEPTRWWCVPRREFCFSRVRFRDWGSRYDENDEVMLKPDDLVYDMVDGFLPIVKDALTRRCGGSEPAGNLSEKWSKWSDKGPETNSSK